MKAFFLIFFFFFFIGIKSDQTLFVSTKGEGTACTQDNPCSFKKSTEKITNTNTVISFKEGDYDISEIKVDSLQNDLTLLGNGKVSFFQPPSSTVGYAMFVLGKNGIKIKLENINIKNTKRHFFTQPAKIEDNEIEMINSSMENCSVSIFDESEFYLSKLHLKGSSFTENIHGLKLNNNGHFDVDIDNCKFEYNIRSALSITMKGYLNIRGFNSTFIGNQNLDDSQSNGYGGGIMIDIKGEDIKETSLDVDFKYTDFLENQALKGGAIFLFNQKGDSVIDLQTCKFVKNRCSYLGGAIYAHSPYSKLIPMVIDNCDFNENFSEENGGAIILYFTLDAIGLNIQNSRFIHNQANKDGGAISIQSGSGSIITYIHETVFSSNIANDRGGALYLDSQSKNVTTDFHKVTFSQNRAFFGGAIDSISSFLFSNMEECVFKSNRAFLGGSIFIYGTYVEQIIENVIFLKNVAENNGGAIFVSGNTINKLDIYDSEFSENHAPNGGAIYVYVSNNAYSNMAGNLFYANNGYIGACIYMQFNYPTLIFLNVSSTFHLNTADGASVLAITPFGIEKEKQNGNNEVEVDSYHSSFNQIFSRIDFDTKFRNLENPAKEKENFFNSQISGTVVFEKCLIDENMGYGDAAAITISVRNLEVVFKENTFSKNVGGGYKCPINNIESDSLRSEKNVFIENEAYVTAYKHTSETYGDFVLKKDKLINQNSFLSCYQLEKKHGHVDIEGLEFRNNRNGLFYVTGSVNTMIGRELEIINSSITLEGPNALFYFDTESLIEEFELLYSKFINTTNPILIKTRAKQTYFQNVEVVNHNADPDLQSGTILLKQFGVVEIHNCFFQKTSLKLEDLQEVKIDSSKFYSDSLISINSSSADVNLHNLEIFGGGKKKYGKIRMHGGLRIEQFKTFKGEHLQIENNYNDYGGGLAVKFHKFSTLFRLKNSNIRNNAAKYGGGILFEGDNSNCEIIIGEPKIQDVMISGNVANFGSSIIFDLKDLEFSMSPMISNNPSIGGSSIYYIKESKPIEKIDVPPMFTEYYSDAFERLVGISPVEFTVFPKIDCHYDNSNVTKFICNIHQVYLINNNGGVIKKKNEMPDRIKFRLDGYDFILDAKDEITFDISFPEEQLNNIPLSISSKLRMIGFGKTFLHDVNVDLKIKSCSYYDQTDLRCIENIVGPIIFVVIVFSMVLVCICAIFSVGFCLFYCTTGKFLDEYDRFLFTPDIRKGRKNRAWYEIFTKRILDIIFCFKSCNPFIIMANQKKKKKGFKKRKKKGKGKNTYNTLRSVLNVSSRGSVNEEAFDAMYDSDFKDDDDESMESSTNTDSPSEDDHSEDDGHEVNLEGSINSSSKDTFTDDDDKLKEELKKPLL